MYYVVNYDFWENHGCFYDFYEARNKWETIKDPKTIIEHFTKKGRRKIVWPLKKKFKKS